VIIIQFSARPQLSLPAAHHIDLNYRKVGSFVHTIAFSVFCSFVVLSSPPPSFTLLPPLRSRYSPQHPVFKYSLPSSSIKARDQI
jgi:hypothetical protein